MFHYDKATRKRERQVERDRVRRVRVLYIMSRKFTLTVPMWKRPEELASQDVACGVWSSGP